MSDETNYGTPWRSDELDLILADYFVMLAADLGGKSYVKSRHCEMIMARLGRSHRSVEFKHQNISAVLEELGLPWIPGYKPKPNYQNAIFDAVERYLVQHPSVLETVAEMPTSPPETASTFVEAPITMQKDRPTPMRLQRLVRKFDPVERDHRNRNLGKAGEAFVVEVERRRLRGIKRADLAEKVRWIADEEGDGAGYDVLSFDGAGREQFIEVKTTNGAARTPFFLTRNERELATEKSSIWRIYRVHLFAQSPRIFTLFPPLERSVILKPETWRASF